MPDISTCQRAEPRDVEPIDAIIAAAYHVISGPAGQKRDWNRERSLFCPGARIMPTASVPGRNDVELEPQCWMSKSISRGRSHFCSKAFTRRKLHDESSGLADLPNVGALT